MCRRDIMIRNKRGYRILTVRRRWKCKLIRIMKSIAQQVRMVVLKVFRWLSESGRFSNMDERRVRIFGLKGG
jgi:hypothetical protein